MTVNFCLYPVNLCLPVSRKELLSEIVEKKLYGTVTNIWHHPGHVFITTDDGRKLFTFDCKPVDHDHVFDTGNLDIASIPSSVCEVCMTSEFIALVVAINGHVQCWKFTKNYMWSHVGDIDLCSSPDSSVISVTYMKTAEKIVWCERQKKNTPDLNEADSSLYNHFIKSRTFSTAADFSTPDMKKPTTHQLIRNCPSCSVIAMTADFLLIQTQYKEEQVIVTLICTVDLQQMKMFLGNEIFSIPESNSIVFDFSSLLLSHISSVLKCQANSGNLGLKQCLYENQVVSLTSGGNVEIYNTVKVHGNEETSKRSFQLNLEDSSPEEIKHWFLCSGHIGIIYNKSLQLYSLQDGLLKYKWQCEDLGNISVVVSSSSPSFLTWILTDKGLFSLQRNESKDGLPYSSPKHLPHNNLLQTDILHLAYLHQLKLEGYDKDVANKLQELKGKLTEGRKSHQVQIADRIEPLIDEYMRLENLSKSLKESKQEVLKAPETDYIHSLIERELLNSKTASKVDHHSKLLWLSNVYPQQLLQHLTQGITLDSELILGEMSEWQALLDLDGHDLSKFEIVCRLLFVLHPEKLVHFVHCAETVNEHKIGVSAFMRKRHTLIFCKTACDCLPPAETSHNPSVAGLAYSQLILTCKDSNSEERALKYLLAQGLWSEAVNLLKTECRDKEILSCYLFITVSALAKNQVLSEYLPQIFEIMPSWKSFLTCSKLAMARPEIREQQLSSYASNVFQQDDSDVCIADIKPFFLKLVQNMNENEKKSNLNRKPKV